MRYFAYGSNMNVSLTQQRCSGIARIGKSRLNGFRLVFNNYADIIPEEGCTVHGGLWQITGNHEDALDKYEDYPEYYSKYYREDVMFYRMREASGNLAPPASWYLKIVIQGYKDFGLTQADFEESLGVQQLGLTQTDVERILGESMAELERLFSRVATSITY